MPILRMRDINKRQFVNKKCDICKKWIRVLKVVGYNEIDGLYCNYTPTICDKCQNYIDFIYDNENFDDDEGDFTDWFNLDTIGDT